MPASTHRLVRHQPRARRLQRVKRQLRSPFARLPSPLLLTQRTLTLPQSSPRGRDQSDRPARPHTFPPPRITPCFGGDGGVAGDAVSPYCSNCLDISMFPVPAAISSAVPLPDLHATRSRIPFVRSGFTSSSDSIQTSLSTPPSVHDNPSSPYRTPSPHAPQPPSPTTPRTNPLCVSRLSAGVQRCPNATPYKLGPYSLGVWAVLLAGAGERSSGPVSAEPARSGRYRFQRTADL